MNPSFGVNYWPSYAGPGMWRDFREEEIAKDLSALRSSGVGYLRAFLFWPDFMPEAERVEPQMLERLNLFLGICGQQGLDVFLTFLVGHMSGENWAPPWMPDPVLLFTDEKLLAAQDRYFRDVIGAIHGQPSLAGYVVSNELPLFTGPADETAVTAWSRRIYATIRALDAKRPVSIGDGAWYLAGNRQGFGPQMAQDVVAPHLYLAETHFERQVAAYGLGLAMARRRAEGKEVWLEEFGATHSVFGEKEVAELAYRVAVEARLHGARRLFWWCGLDFPAELGERDPYRHHAHELSFGLLDSERQERAVAGALRDAMSSALPELRPAGVLVPSYLLERYPFSEEPSELAERALRNCYAALRNLGYLPSVVLEEDLAHGLDPLPEVLVVPSTQKLLAPSWSLLRDYPGKLIYSYLHGAAVRSHEGAWIGAEEARAFFGGEPHNHFNLPEKAPRVLRGPGGRLRLPRGNNPFAETPLLVAPRQARVLGTDEAGRPLWLRVGRRDLLLYPLEALAANPQDVATFYRWALQS